jgi:tRNA (cmo5U34)-methyltransferase
MTTAPTAELAGRWTFEDAGLAASFGDHVREQLPWYDIATRLVLHVAQHYVRVGGLVYDIGAATGNISAQLAPTCRLRESRLVAIESSAAMCAAFAPIEGVELVEADATAYAFEPFDVAVCFLVLMFLAPVARRALLAELVEQLRPGGCLVVFERWLRPLPPYLALCSQRWTLAEKLRAGAEPPAILAKEAALVGVQRPVDLRLLQEIALPTVELFRCGEFAGYVVERPE